MEKALEGMRSQSSEQMLWLGARLIDQTWHLPVMGDIFCIDLSLKCVRTKAGQDVGPVWRLLAFHYLAIRSRFPCGQPELTFGDLPEARAYSQVYRQRVCGRLCATVGRDRDSLAAASAATNGRPAGGGDLAFDFDVFPHLPLRLIWYAGDDEFSPSATLLLPRNIQRLFCLEDIVVLSERVVSRLSGQPF